MRMNPGTLAYKRMNPGLYNPGLQSCLTRGGVWGPLVPIYKRRGHGGTVGSPTHLEPHVVIVVPTRHGNNRNIHIRDLIV